MKDYLKYTLVVSMVVSACLPGMAQFSLAPQINIGIPVGNANTYATPQLGYGAEIGYQLAERWGATVAYDLYAFEVGTNLEDLDISPALLRLLNLPERFALDLEARSWSGGFRYSLPYFKVVPFVGVVASTNTIKVSGYGLSISRSYWGVAPILGMEWPLAPRWSLRADARVQTIFLQEDIPFVENIIKEHLVFVPIHAGLVFQLAKGKTYP